ncbi:K(+)-transporting ATPase subunit F [Streptomyces shenzhenensis]|uniref:K(+)-transporting ATPase subunit F n=1 Tax=Streptomyces shenzhenensis TaxID=943815 RepID=A0A3M0HX55_9ACTN|nr:K(+)-transporting ATPase subunit F [Streptomyces shenzhenensis]
MNEPFSPDAAPVVVSAWSRRSRAFPSRRRYGGVAHAGSWIHRSRHRRVRPDRSDRQGSEPTVSVDNVVGLVVAVCLVVYLVLCLIFPERF